MEVEIPKEPEIIPTPAAPPTLDTTIPSDMDITFGFEKK